MASHERETSLLPSELFQQEDHDVFSQDYNNNNNNIMLSPKGLRSFESNFSSFGSAYSSWSDYSSPLSSELGSTSETTESEEDEELFISELTRQMAEYMLQDDNDDINNNNNNNNQDHENTVSHYVPENSEASDLTVNWSECKSSSVSYYNSQGFMNKSVNPSSDSANVENVNTGIHPDDYSTDEQFPPVQVYQLKNQPQMRKQGSYGGRRVKATESTQQQIQHKEQQNMQNKGKAWKYGHGKKTTVPLLPSPPSPAAGGSGMRAIFLGGSERNASSGTGVFLPSGTYRHSTPEPKRKSGCSTVLIPARVLQTLQQHFNTVGGLSPLQSQSPSTISAASTNLPWQNDVLARINGLLSQQKEHAEFETRPAAAAAEIKHHQEVQLPQEWTY